MSRKKKIVIVLSIVILVTFLILLTQIGFYTIQPIGALPEGSTWLVWRKGGEPFFNSADAVSLKTTGTLSLLSRGLSLSSAPKERIIAKFSYWEFAYLQSTGGKKFDK